MKLRPTDLPAKLSSNPVFPVYLVYGDEPLLSLESCDYIRRFLSQKGFSEREVFQVDGHFSWEGTLQSTNALSLFSEQKILEIRLGESKINKADSQHLQAYLDNPAPDTTLLLVADKLDAGSKKSAWYSTIDKLGLMVEIWPLEPQQLPGWLIQRGIALGLHLDTEAAQLLSDRVEGNLLAARQELDKLRLLCADGQISAEQILEAVSDNSRYDVFALMDAALMRQPVRCQKILQVIRQEGVEAPVVLWAITREIRTLYALMQGLSRGMSADALCQKEKVWGKRKGPVLKACQRLHLDDLEKMLSQAALADHAIKGQGQHDPWLIMAQLVLALAGAALPLVALEA